MFRGIFFSFLYAPFRYKYNLDCIRNAIFATQIAYTISNCVESFFSLRFNELTIQSTYAISAVKSILCISSKERNKIKGKKIAKNGVLTVKFHGVDCVTNAVQAIFLYY